MNLGVMTALPSGTTDHECAHVKRPSREWRPNEKGQARDGAWGRLMLTLGKGHHAVTLTQPLHITKLPSGSEHSSPVSQDMD